MWNNYSCNILGDKVMDCLKCGMELTELTISGDSCRLFICELKHRNWLN